LPLHTHSPFKTANKSVKLWRYLSFPKFVDLLEEKSLFFSRSDKLGDPCEGSYPKLSAGALGKYATDPNVVYATPEQVEATRKTLRYMMMISCWNMRDSDSYLMWKGYTDSSDSTCIQTSAEILLTCLDQQSAHHVLVSEITYIDYDLEEIPSDNILNAFVYKRRYYQEENELRAIVWIPGEEWRYIEQAAEPDEYPLGIRVPVNVSDLVQTIYLHPDAPRWQEELVSKLSKRYGLNCPIVKSAISSEPIF
jgi:hypothetical protein